MFNKIRKKVVNSGTEQKTEKELSINSSSEKYNQIKNGLHSRLDTAKKRSSELETRKKIHN